MKLICKSQIREKWILWLIFAVAAFIRVYKIADYQVGLHIDEASIGYDAYCIATYGVDRHLLPYPVLFLGFGGGGHSALYTYCVALLDILIGSSIYSLRIPAVVFSMVAVVAGTGIIHHIFQSAEKDIICALILSFCPYFFMASRFALDCNLMLGISTLFLYFFIRAADTLRTRYYLLAGITGGIVLFTYSLAYIVMPIFLIVSFYYCVKYKRVSVRNALIFTIPIMLLASPLLYEQSVNIFRTGTQVVGSISFPMISDYRGNELTYPQITSVVNALKASLLYDMLLYNSNPKYGNFYYCLVPFVVYGVVLGGKQFSDNQKKQMYNPLAFTVFWLLAEVITASLRDRHLEMATNQVNGVFAVLALFAALGISGFGEQLKNKKKYFFVALTGIFLCSAVIFYYDVINDRSIKMYCGNDYTDVLEYINNTPALDNRVQYLEVMDDRDIFYRYSAKLNPYEEKTDNSINNVVYGIKEEIDKEGIYIIDESNANIGDAIEKRGDAVKMNFKYCTLYYFDEP